MPVEVIGADDGVEKLNEAWPDGSEPVKQGDDHIRNIKKAVKNSFARGVNRSNPNLLINGDFSVDQLNLGKSVPLASPTEYYQDGWIYRGLAGTGGTGTVGQGETADGLYSYVTHAGAIGYGYLAQKIEAVSSNDFVGKELTFSAEINFDVQVDSKLTCFWVAAKSWAAVSSVVTTDLATTTGRERVTATFTVPPITSWAKGVDYVLVIRFDYVKETDVIPNGTFRFHNAKLEYGELATDFLAESPAANLARCQRYYYVDTMRNSTRYAYPLSDVAQYWSVQINWPVPMRVTPVVDYDISGFTQGQVQNETPTQGGLYLQFGSVTSGLYGGIRGLKADARM